MSTNAFGIDLGTSNIKIYSAADDKIMIEKNMIAVQNKKTVFAYGDSAYEMYEKAPGNIQISYPLCNGVIADIKNMETLIRFFVTDMSGGNIKPADFYIAVPTDITEVEKRAFYDLIKDANVKARKIMVVEKAVADGLGLDIDVKNSQGVLVVNVGYDTTEVSILSLGGIVLSRLIKTGGLKFDEAIRSAVRKEYGLLIGGNAYAGGSGRSEHYVAALEMAPQKIKIGDFKYITNEKSKWAFGSKREERTDGNPGGIQPQMAYVENNSIILKPITNELLNAR